MSPRRTLPWIAAALVAAALLAVAPLAAQPINLNGSFDANLAGWTATDPADVSAVHSSVDAGESCRSGGVLLTDLTGHAGRSSLGVDQCLQVAAGQTYEARAWVQKVPNQTGTGRADFGLFFFSSTDCSGAVLGINAGSADSDSAPADGRWRLLEVTDQVAPAGARSATVFAAIVKDVANTTFRVWFDEIAVCAAGSCGIGLADGDTFESPVLPGHRFRALIGKLDATLMPATKCLPKTLCLSGALAGRAEVMLRVIGPRPDGHLWFQAVRFTPSEVTLEVEQLSTGVVRRYLLTPSAPGERPASVEDREAFLP